MNYDYNFQRDDKFFKESKTYLNLLEIAHKKDVNFSKDIVVASTKLFVESVIKHNLDINMLKVDPFLLISNENSDEVKKTLGKIRFKLKDKRTASDFKKLQDQDSIQNAIALYAYAQSDNNIDIFANLKQEFIDFKVNEKKVTSKLKIK